jgi:hypothetical protein
MSQRALHVVDQRDRPLRKSTTRLFTDPEDVTSKSISQLPDLST